MPHFGWRAADCRLEDFMAVLAQPGPAAERAVRVSQGVPVYDGDALRAALAHDREALMAEWAAVLMHGAGIVVIERLVDDLAALDAASALFRALIAEQHAAGAAAADHFAAAGANDRIWNALQKHGLRDPEGFVRYYGNPLLAAVCEAWLGPGWQMTAQVNVVNPGGAAQSPHRDYHLGFMTAAQAEAFPAHVHALSPALTLQGAVAHVDMPAETGPTLYLPGSQRYAPGYLACGLPVFRDYFDAHHVQLPLRRGDAVFFNPALLHAAGHNRTPDVRRMANLLQVSSAMGRAMESVDRTSLSLAVYPVLRRLLADGRLDAARADAAVAACAEGYAFPTNLDTDPPRDGLAPPAPAALMRRALGEGWDAARFGAALQAQAARRRA
ncbi:phytanoyl-CoA dioxygenase family protein [Piscinibacter defluvii]|uniref:phytanoyl-CoA dioxygenase family protein n=1 Tax=Piscinibacter defluvii TaxID=1796922 RepID=UPI000FDD502F|nr:phytanoyl-CoA dioxygenase family protein [Piscinibacter defluvii]